MDGGSTRSAYSIAVIGAQTFKRVELFIQGRVDAFTIVFQPGRVFRQLACVGRRLWVQPAASLLGM
jgi:hypothetical protein